MRVIIRKVIINDLENFKKLCLDIFNLPPPGDWYNYMVAEYKNELIGMGGLTFLGHVTNYDIGENFVCYGLFGLGVKRKYRKIGIGEQILKCLVDEKLKSKMPVRIEWFITDGAENFYKKVLPRMKYEKSKYTLEPTENMKNHFLLIPKEILQESDKHFVILEILNK